MKYENMSNEELFISLRSLEKEHQVLQNYDLVKHINYLKDEIIRKNYGIIFKFLLKGKKLPDFDTYESEIFFTVTKAIKCYDLNKGVKWSTYLHNSISRTYLDAMKISKGLNNGLLRKSISFDFNSFDEKTNEEKEDLMLYLIPAALKKAKLSSLERKIIDVISNSQISKTQSKNMFGISYGTVLRHKKSALEKIKKKLIEMM